MALNIVQSAQFTTGFMNCFRRPAQTTSLPTKSWKRSISLRQKSAKNWLLSEIARDVRSVRSLVSKAEQFTVCWLSGIQYVRSRSGRMKRSMSCAISLRNSSISLKRRKTRMAPLLLWKCAILTAFIAKLLVQLHIAPKRSWSKADWKITERHFRRRYCHKRSMGNRINCRMSTRHLWRKTCNQVFIGLGRGHLRKTAFSWSLQRVSELPCWATKSSHAMKDQDSLALNAEQGEPSKPGSEPSKRQLAYGEIPSMRYKLAIGVTNIHGPSPNYPLLPRYRRNKRPEYVCLIKVYRVYSRQCRVFSIFRSI